MGGSLSKGILLVAVIAIIGLFAHQQWGSDTEIAIQPQPSGIVATASEHAQPASGPIETAPAQAPQQLSATSETVQETAASSETQEIEPPVFHEGMSADEFKTAYREWRVQKAAREGKLDQFYAQEEQRQQQTRQRSAHAQQRRKEREQWRTSMKEWREKRQEALRLGLPVPPRPSMTDFMKTEASGE